jgi:hypothetical protein
VSHSIITFRDETLDKVFVMEANGRGFMLVPWAKWRKHNTLVARFSISAPGDEQLESLRALGDSLGAEYDYRSLFGFILRRFSKRMTNPLDNSKKLICSEAVAKFLVNLDPRFQDPSSWSPEDLMSEIQARPKDVFVLEESAGS